MWVCRTCNEELEDQFNSRWRCIQQDVRTTVDYQTVFEILHSSGIRDFADLQNLNSSMSSSFALISPEHFQSDGPTKAQSLGRVDYITDKDYPWVKDIFTEVLRIYPDVLASFHRIPQPRIVSGSLYNPFGHHTWSVDDEIFNLRAKYSCLFPKRMLFLSGQFIYWELDDCIGIPTDFFPLLFALKPALNSGLAFLLPSRMNHKTPTVIGEVSRTLIRAFNRDEDGPAVVIPSNGYGYRDLENVLSKEKLTDSNTQLFTIPWLQGARLEDYIELVNRFPKEFELYVHMLEKFFEARSESDKITLEWIKEVSNGIRRIDVIFKNKQTELNAKGFDVGAGMLLTLGTLMLPETMAALKPSLAALFSSKTAYDGLRWLYDYRQAKKLISSENHWLLWRLMR